MEFVACVSQIKSGFLCLPSVSLFSKVGLGIGNFNKHPTRSSNAVGKLAKNTAVISFHFQTFKSQSFQQAKRSNTFSTLLFMLGITKGANRGYIIPQMAHEHRNNQTILWNFPTRTCGEIDTVLQIIFVLKEVRKVCWPLHMIALHPEQAL